MAQVSQNLVIESPKRIIVAATPDLSKEPTKMHNIKSDIGELRI
jgi:hypothetical protein